MDVLEKVTKINLAILLGSMVLVFALEQLGMEIYFISFSICIVIAQPLVNLVISIINFIRRKNELAKACLVNVFIVAIVGFSACLGGVGFYSVLM